MHVLKVRVYAIEMKGKVIEESYDCLRVRVCETKWCVIDSCAYVAGFKSQQTKKNVLLYKIKVC